jgi:hypothetical protein
VAYGKNAEVKEKKEQNRVGEDDSENDPLASVPILAFTELLAGTILYRPVPH